MPLCLPIWYLNCKIKPKWSHLCFRWGQGSVRLISCQSCSWAKLRLSDVTHLYPLALDKLAVLSKDTVQVGSNTGMGRNSLGCVLHARSKTELLHSLIYINMLADSVNYQFQLWHKHLCNRLGFFRNFACFNCISSGEQLFDFRNFKWRN